MNTLDRRYGVLARQETADWRASNGPILFEAVGHQLSLGGAIERVRRMAKSETQICRLLYVDIDGVRMDGAERVIERAIATIKAAEDLILQSTLTPASTELLEALRRSFNQLVALDV
jgi:hypothetical protein